MSEYCEKYLIEAKKWIGKKTEKRWGRFPVEYEPIRRWCHMVNCLNPLYLDPEYVGKTRWGKVLCPPLMIPIFAHHGWPPSPSGPEIDWPPPEGKNEPSSITPPTPGSHTIIMGGGFEFYKPVFIGDRLGSQEHLVNIYIKSIRLDPEAFWINNETLFLNQHMEVVAKRSLLRIQHRDREQIAATTPEQLAQISP